MKQIKAFYALFKELFITLICLFVGVWLLFFPFDLTAWMPNIDPISSIWVQLTLGFFGAGYAIARIFLRKMLSGAIHTLVAANILVISANCSLFLFARIENISNDFPLLISALLWLNLLSLSPLILYLTFLSTKKQPLFAELESNLSKIYPAEYKQAYITTQSVEKDEPSNLYNNPLKETLELYRKKFEDIFGKVSGRSDLNIPPFQAFLPTILTTTLISLGWLYSVFSSVTSSPIQLNPIVYGFLGAYLFSLQFLFRRYVQSDLGPAAYANVNLRFIATFIWAVLLWTQAKQFGLLDVSKVSVLMFIVGIFPDVAWQLLYKQIRSYLPNFSRGNSVAYSLDQIMGITIWVETRLIEEGIENVVDLATANLPELLLQTNYPLIRLIDWIDQAILQVHLLAYVNNPENSPTTEIGKQSLAGITTASSFLAYYKKLSSDEGKPFVRLVTEIANEANLYHINAWHAAYPSQ